jgi:hypothetical protein
MRKVSTDFDMYLPRTPTPSLIILRSGPVSGVTRLASSIPFPIPSVIQKTKIRARQKTRLLNRKTGRVVIKMSSEL